MLIMYSNIGKIVEIENVWSTAQQLAMYMITVIIGLIIHAVITLPGIYFAITHRNPLAFFRGKNIKDNDNDDNNNNG